MPLVIPCRSCGRLTPLPQCEECAAKSEARKYQRNKAAGLEGGPSFYNTGFWRRLRARVLTRDQGACVVCQGRDRLTVHHVRPRPQGVLTPTPYDRLENLVTLDMRCHSRYEQMLRGGNVDEQIMSAIRLHLKVLYDLDSLLD